MFYLLAALLLVLGATVVLLGLRRRDSQSSALPPEDTVAALYRDRLAELRREIAGGQAEPEDQALLEAELSAALLADFESSERTGARENVQRPMSANGLIMGLASVGLLLASTVLVYRIVGDPAAMQIAGAESVLRMDPTTDNQALNGWRVQLVERLDDRPGDAKSWYLLGHVDLKLGRFNTAAEAFAMAHQAFGEDSSIDVFWLQARYLAAKGEFDATSRSIADRVLARQPNQPLVLELYAVDTFRRGAFQESVSLLNRALSGSLESGHRLALERGFAEARAQLGDLPVTVDVEIGATAQTPDNSTLFVIARPIGGGMPFAVVRRPAGEFPRTVRLDDAVSMNPAAPLSSAPTIEVVVRLSRSGTAMAHPGDWEWQSDPVAVAELTSPVRLSATLAPPG